MSATSSSEGDALPALASFNGKLEKFIYTPDPSSTSRRLTRASARTLLESHSAQPTTSSGKRKAEPSDTKDPIAQKRRVVSKSASSSGSASPTKKKRVRNGYAPPSKYAHIPNLLTDALCPNLICVFVGVNPGLLTARTGHAYSHPSNLFWKLLHSSGCTPRRCSPLEDHDLPELFELGHTNIVSRATKDASELSKEEMVAGVEILEEKIKKFRPECVAIVGKSIWEAIWKARYRQTLKKEQFKYGWQDEDENMGVTVKGSEEDGWRGARVFVTTSTSGLAASLRPAEKEAIWQPLGEFVVTRREERRLKDPKRQSENTVNPLVET